MQVLLFIVALCNQWKGASAVLLVAQERCREAYERAGRRSLLTAVTALHAPGAQERMAFLKSDLVHLFDDKGIDKSQYDDVVQFRWVPVLHQRTVLIERTMAALLRPTHMQSVVI